MCIVEGEGNQLTIVCKGVHWVVITGTSGIVSFEIARATVPKLVYQYCDMQNDTNAVYCKKCGKRFSSDL